MGNVLLGGKSLKPSHVLEGGENLDVLLPQKEIRIKVLEIPAARSVAKADRPRFSQIEILKEI